MELNEVSGKIVDAAFHIHQETGPGLLENVYETILADRLKTMGLPVERQLPIPIRFEGKQYDEGFRADIVVDNSIIVEVKSVETLARVHKKQVLTYLKLSGLRLGLLINFGGETIKGNIERLVAGQVTSLPPRPL